MSSNHLILCHPLLLSLQSFPASGFFQMSQFFASDGQNFGASTLTSILPMNTQDRSPLECTGWISLQSKGLSRVYSNTTQFRSINSSALTLLYGPTLTSMPDYWRNHSFDSIYLCQKSDASAFQYAVQVCHIFPSKQKHLLIS